MKSIAPRSISVMMPPPTPAGVIAPAIVRQIVTSCSGSSMRREKRRAASLMRPALYAGNKRARDDALAGEVVAGTGGGVRAWSRLIGVVVVIGRGAFMRSVWHGSIAPYA